MTLPGWVLSVGLVFWGVAVGVWPLGVLFGIVVWIPRIVERRVAFSRAEVCRAFDICWLLFLGGVLLTYSREPVGSVLRSFARWLPVVFFPGMLVQSWNEGGRLPMAAILPLPWWRGRDHGDTKVDISGPFLVFCVLSASLAGSGVAWFYPGLVLVTAMAFWRVRARGYSGLAVGLFFGISAAGGWLVGLGLGGLQGWFENSFLNWVTQWRRDEASFRSARTAIGSTGDVGGSGGIVLTVRGEGDAKVPPRLRIAVFSAWSDGTWYAPSGGFEKVEGTGGEWTLDGTRGLTGSIRVEMRRDATGGLLAVPGGTRVIGDTSVEGIEKTPLGAVRGNGGGSMVPYRTDYGPDAGWELAPTDEEGREIRVLERPAIEALVEEMGLAGRSAEEATSRIADFFAREFRYTTLLEPSRSKDPRAQTPLGRFLLSDRAGHCEYFATAGVLLLRAVGVPARYATGFQLNPTDRENGLYFVRGRHAHAWVRVWMNGRWQDFDPTPPVLWEATSSAGWERFWSRIRFGFLRWWWLGERRWLREAYWLVLPVLMLMAWRFRRLRASRKGARSGNSEPIGTRWPGKDSEWFLVEPRLAACGLARTPGEPREGWRHRLATECGVTDLGGRVGRAHELHERLRFDPQGLGSDERRALRELSGTLVADLLQRASKADQGAGVGRVP